MGNNSKTQHILINEGKTAVTIVTKTEGVVTFLPPAPSGATPVTIHGIVAGVDSFGMNLSFIRDDTDVPFLIPLRYIVSIDQGLDTDNNLTSQESNGSFFVRSGSPSDMFGLDGSIWFDTNSPNNVYYKQNGHWTFRCSLKGEPGIQGAPGKAADRMLHETVQALPLMISKVYYKESAMFQDCDNRHVKPGEILCFYNPDEFTANLYFYTGYLYVADPPTKLDRYGLISLGTIRPTDTMFIHGRPGTDGETPYIDQTTNRWMIAGKDLGVSAIGPQGPRGLQGPVGKDGERGPAGPAGPQGKPGDSLYYHPITKRFMVGAIDITNQLTDFVTEVVDKVLHARTNDDEFNHTLRQLNEGKNPTK